MFLVPTAAATTREQKTFTISYWMKALKPGSFFLFSFFFLLSFEGRMFTRKILPTKRVKYITEEASAKLAH